METLTGWIAVPLGFIMEWCYRIIGNYGVAILIFTVFTKIIIMPISVWVQKNSIKTVQMQPEINRIKVRFFGDPDSIAEEEAKLHKKFKYNPFVSLVPLFVQIVLLLGIVGVIYHPFDYLFHFDSGIVGKMTALTAQLTGTDVAASSIQLATIKAVQDPAYFESFAAIDGTAEMLSVIKNFDLNFLGFDLSVVPSVVWGVSIIIPILAGLSSYLLCYVQNKINVLQAEQSAAGRWGTLIFSVGLSLYLGFFVPVGIVIYWIAGNILATLVAVLLNVIIPPKKYVDYDDLEASRKELAELQAIAPKKKLWEKDEFAKRERADYKRFFSVANKHIVFYSEKSGFYKYYKAIIEYLLKKTTVVIHYITNDPNDKIFELAKEQPKIKPYYIGVKKLIPLMMKLEADIVVMTTPELDNSYIKRSLYKKDINYIFVPHDPSSMNMGFREHSLDNFDTVFCTGPHIAAECRATEALYGTKEKTLVEFGYPLIDDLISSYEAMEKTEGERKTVLLAPSWQEDNLLDCCIEQLIDSLYGDEYKIIVRPHPEYMKRFAPKMDKLVEKYSDKIGEGLCFELDFSSNTSVYSSDILVTDWSGVGIEFGFATLKPVIFINTKMKAANPNWEKIGILPQQIRLRDVLGVSLDKEEIAPKFADTVKELITSDSFAENARKEREEYFYNLRSNGVVGAKYIISQLVKKK